MNSELGPLNINEMDFISRYMTDEIYQQCKNIVAKIEDFI